MSKLKPIQAINKAFISWGIKNNDKVKVYYAFDQKRQPKKTPFIMVDYDKKIREWYISYIEDLDKYHYATIDDITGTISIT